MSRLWQSPQANARGPSGGPPEACSSGPEVAASLAPNRIGAVADVLRAIKRERDALVLVHEQLANGMLGDLADVVGDTLSLGRAASGATEKVMVVCGLGFMAEWVKLQAPEKIVLLPLPDAGCDLAESVTPEDVHTLRAQHPGLPVVAHISTSAAVKAESDACCTSANAVRVIEALASPQVIFLPDQALGNYVATRTPVKLVVWPGRCDVHERFDRDQARQTRDGHDAVLLAHPGCAPEVLAEADFVGAPEAMARWIGRARPRRIAVVAQCAIADHLRHQYPRVEFVQPCRYCPPMQRLSIRSVIAALRRRDHEVTLPDRVAAGARRAMQRMFAIDMEACL